MHGTSGCRAERADTATPTGMIRPFRRFRPFRVFRVLLFDGAELEGSMRRVFYSMLVSASIWLLVLIGPAFAHTQSPSIHPTIFITKAEGAQIRAAAGKYPLLDRSLAEAKATMAAAFADSIDVPPPG